MLSFNKKLWEQMTFSRIDGQIKLPAWPCRRCWKSTLSFHKDFDLHEPNTEADSIMEENVFCCALSCRECGQKIIVSGEKTITEHPYEDEQGHNFLYETKYRPSCFFPNLRLFFDSDFPEKITKLIDRSFALYFSDTDMAATRLRTMTEHLLDLKIFGSIPRKNGNDYLTLDKRIKKITVPIKKELLKAIKLLGNRSTHLGKIRKNDYLKAVGIMYHILHNMFSKEKERINIDAKQLIKKLAKKK